MPAMIHSTLLKAVGIVLKPGFPAWALLVPPPLVWFQQLVLFWLPLAACFLGWRVTCDPEGHQCFPVAYLPSRLEESAFEKQTWPLLLDHSLQAPESEFLISLCHCLLVTGMSWACLVGFQAQRDMLCPAQVSASLGSKRHAFFSSVNKELFHWKFFSELPTVNPTYVQCGAIDLGINRF